MIDDFIKRKHGTKKIEYELPELKSILEETYGVIVYQEQVMQIAHSLAGYSLGEADLLRRAMGKKKAGEMAAHREKFVEGSRSKNLGDSKKNYKDFSTSWKQFCRLWIQQISLGRLCPAGLPYCLSQDALSRLLHGGSTDQ